MNKNNSDSIRGNCDDTTHKPPEISLAFFCKVLDLLFGIEESLFFNPALSGRGDYKPFFIRHCLHNDWECSNEKANVFDLLMNEKYKTTGTYPELDLIRKEADTFLKTGKLL